MELQVIQQKIYEIRGLQVMLDYDLAALYGVETKYLKRAVRNNMLRFPDDFMFELTKEEYDWFKVQILHLKSGGRGEHSKYLPFAFTEHGVAQLSSVLNSEKAIRVNINIVRAFVAVRQWLLENKDHIREIDNLRQRVQQLEQYSVETLRTINDLSADTRSQFDDIYLALTELTVQKQLAEKPRNPIGFRQ